MRFNILFGGAAGQGPNILGELLGKSLVNQGYYVFYSRDYQSLIRGGHNFNVLTFSEKPVYGNDSQIDILVALDENTVKIHEKNLKKTGVILKGHKENMYYAGRLFKLLCIDFKILDSELKQLKKRYNENIAEAKKGYDEERKKVCEVVFQKDKIYFQNGTQGVAEGAIKSGLDIYYAYPMTPATPVLTELAQKQVENNFLVLELENEISVVNAGIGSALTGAKTMVGTSGGGFSLMAEGLSSAAMSGAPLVFYLSQRPGPASGVPTYTSQGDLNMARHAGHGEFNRIVFAPGDPQESVELTSQAFYFSQKFKIPSIILNDKHGAESFYSLTEKPKITSSIKSITLQRYNTYEKDSTGAATDDPEIIKKNFENRLKTTKEIIKEAEKFISYKIHGKKDSKNIIVSWGSPKGAILDAMQNLNCCFLQILYIEPFSEKIKEILKNKNIILVENNSTAPLAGLIAEKTGIFICDKNKILRYDARPFLADELKLEIEGRLK